MKNTAFLFFLLFHSFCFATCIDLRNIEFQKVDAFKFLSTSAGKNIAFINVDTLIPDNQITFRFYADKLCDTGAEAEFQMNGRQSKVRIIVLFK